MGEEIRISLRFHPRKPLDCLQLSNRLMTKVSILITQVKNISVHRLTKRAHPSGPFKNNHLCDYQMMTPSISLSDLEAMISENGDNGVKCEDYYMYLSAYLALESLNKYPHVNKLLIFCNRKRKCPKSVRIY